MPQTVAPGPLFGQALRLPTKTVTFWTAETVGDWTAVVSESDASGTVTFPAVETVGACAETVRPSEDRETFVPRRTAGEFREAVKPSAASGTVTLVCVATVGLWVCSVAERAYRDGQDTGEKVGNKEESLAMLRQVIQKGTGCREVEFVGGDGEFHSWGYIDHQSIEDDGGPGKEAFASAEKLRDFIFAKQSFIRTDNDNH